MRLDHARIAPLGDEDMTEAHHALLAPLKAGGPIINVFRTIARSPDALAGFLGWGGYVLGRRNDLPPRERELVILRIGFRCRSGYEWAQHVALGRRVGLTDAEIARVKDGPEEPGWSLADQALLLAADELHEDHFITEATWRELSLHFTEKQRMDLVFTAGQYTQVSMILNSFGVQLDEGMTLDPDLKGA